MRTICAIILAAMLGIQAQAQPKPGDVFREYRWTNTGGDAGGSFRVGGKKGVTDPGRGWATGYVNDPVTLPEAFDLDQVVKAEVVIEKLLCHDGTHGLAISVNGGDWIEIPEATGIPEPQWEYQHHIYPVVAVPLAQLKAGQGNQFRLRVSPEHRWNWPQNLVYGVHFRIYYDAAKKNHPTGKIISPQAGQSIGRLAPLEVSADGEPTRVEFIGCYEDVNYEGDGQYTQWHYRYNRAELINHIGTVTQAPFKLNWNTSWVPDQPAPMQLAAFITNKHGVTVMTEAVGGLRLERPGFCVELCKPYDVPRQWLTRKGEIEEKFKVTGDLKRAVAAQLVFTSWSPGYMNGIFVNGKQVFDKEGPHYAFFFHRIPLADLSVLKQSENVLKTGKTPRNAKGEMVHGAEINWPGIMVLVQYGDVKLNEDARDETAGNLPCYRIDTPAATYYLEKSGAGLSSMIDPDGKDWLSFEPTPGSKAGGEFRGFPNAVNIQGAKGYFHPMNEGTGRAFTKVTHNDSERATITAASEDGRWAGRYDFFPTHCTFTMTEIPAGEKYWALYEGTPGEQYDDSDWWIASDKTERAPLATPHEGDLPAPEWIAFGDAQTSRTIVLAHHEDDPHADRFYQMNRQMTVFGFGRQGLSKFIDKVPQSFSIGFVESTRHGAIAGMIAKLTGVEPAKPAAASAAPQENEKPVKNPSKKAK